MEQKKLDEMNVIELKAVLFDMEQEFKQRQQAYQQVAMQLEKKFKEEQEQKNKPKVEEQLINKSKQ